MLGRVLNFFFECLLGAVHKLRNQGGREGPEIWMKMVTVGYVGGEGGVRGGGGGILKGLPFFLNNNPNFFQALRAGMKTYITNAVTIVQRLQ